MFSKGPKDPERKKAWNKRKVLRKLVKQKKYDEALKLGAEILKKIPEDFDVLFIIGGIYYMKNKLKTAISYFDKALEIGEYDVDVLILKANAHYKLEEIKRAKECCDKIKEIDPKNKAVTELLQKIEYHKK